MGQQHNTHIANATHETIKIVLTDNDGRNTTQIIPSAEYVCIPTSKGAVSVSIFRKDTSDGSFKAWRTLTEAVYSMSSDRSFIVDVLEGNLQIYRAKYGKIWEKDTGLGKLSS